LISAGFSGHLTACSPTCDQFSNSDAPRTQDRDSLLRFLQPRTHAGRGMTGWVLFSTGPTERAGLVPGGYDGALAVHNALRGWPDAWCHTETCRRVRSGG
jgi:hypothetical protein